MLFNSLIYLFSDIPVIDQDVRVEIIKLPFGRIADLANTFPLKTQCDIWYFLIDSYNH